MAVSKTQTGKPSNEILPVTCGPEESQARVVAKVAVGGLANNANTVTTFSKSLWGDDLSLAECVGILGERVKRVQGGDLKDMESLLVAQASALDAIFTTMAARAHANVGSYPQTVERYLRLALKAQSQCRTTVEALASIKNPPVVFARQANITSGPQQVNNGPQQVAIAVSAQNGTVRAGARGRAEESTSVRNELLESDDGEWLDTGTQGTAGGAHSHMATVGASDRPTHD